MAEKKPTLLHYLLRARPDAPKYWPDLIKKLETKDIEIPLFLQHTLEAARFADEKERRRVSDPNGFKSWIRAEEAKRFPGLTENEIAEIEGTDSFTASAAEIPDAERYPKLMAVYHEICDALNLRKFGPNHDQYPRLILVSSDMPHGEILRQGDSSSIRMSTALFELGSSRQALGILIHELAHQEKNTNTTGMKRMMQRFMRWAAPIYGSKKEELYADGLAKKFGISGEEIADNLLQIDHLNMKHKAFISQVKPMVYELGNYDGPEKLPSLFYYLRSMENRCLISPVNATDTHPSTLERVQKVMQQEDAPLSEYWQKRLSGEFNKGELVPHKPPGVGHWRPPTLPVPKR